MEKPKAANMLLVLASHLDADLNVRSLDLLRQRLTDIVQKSRTLCKRRIHAELVCDYAGQERYLDRVIEDVLTVARAVFETAETTYKL